MDDQRRKQIGEEERCRAEVRAKFEREDAAPAVEERPVKKKKRRGCLGNIAIVILVIFVSIRGRSTPIRSATTSRL